MKSKYLIPEESNGILIDNVNRFRECETSLRNVFYKNGFKEILTSTFEYVDFYLDVYGSDIYKLLFKYINNHGENVTLRYDFTLPTARYYLSQNIDKVGKYCYFGKVYRRSNNYDGKRNEINTAGIEILNEKVTQGEKDCVKVIEDSINELVLDNFKIELMSAKFFNRLIAITRDEEVLKVIFNKRSISMVKELIKERDYSDEINNLLMMIIKPFLTYQDLLIINNNISDSILKSSIKDLINLYNLFKDKNNIIFDLCGVPSKKYYNSIIFKVYIKDYVDPVISGGRYDKLCQKLGRNVSAIGLGFNLDYIFFRRERV